MIAPSRALRWQPATVVAVRDETSSARTLRLRPARLLAHVPGQHYQVELAGVVRAYWVASAPERSGEIELTVERLDGGPARRLYDAGPGEELPVRGPIGEHFAWHGSRNALLVGTGSGIVPLTAMLRTARRAGTAERIRLVVAAHPGAELYYAAELPGPQTTVVDPQQLALPVRAGEQVFVSGSRAFCDAVAGRLVAAGALADDIATAHW